MGDGQLVVSRRVLGIGLQDLPVGLDRLAALALRELDLAPDHEARALVRVLLEDGLQGLQGVVPLPLRDRDLGGAQPGRKVVGILARDLAQDSAGVVGLLLLKVEVGEPELSRRVLGLGVGRGLELRLGLFHFALGLVEARQADPRLGRLG